MILKRPVVAIVGLALLATACQAGSVDVPDKPTTTQQIGIEPTTGDDGLDSAREVDRVDCDSAPQEVAIVCEAYELIQIHYVDEVDDNTLAEAAALGLEMVSGDPSEETLACPLPAAAFEISCEAAGSFVGDNTTAAEAMIIGLASHALDPNSGYFDEAALELLEKEEDGEIEGIGALVSPEDETIEGDNKQCSVISDTCRILVVSTIEGAPAEAAGLQRDDIIIGVNGRSISGWTIDEVTSQVRGPAGTDVTLTLERGGDVFDVTITRAAVEIPVLDSETFGQVGYIRLSVFSQNADEKFEDAVVDQLARGVDSLVVDLRNNPGGLLDTAIAVTSLFLPDGDVVVTQGPGESTSYPVEGSAIIPDDLEVIFVVNKGSASASEVVSAVLQERGEITVVGENTFGKNTVQQRFPLSNGGALKLTIARWLTPGGLDFGGVGVTPDIDMLVDGLESEALVAAVLAAA